MDENLKFQLFPVSRAFGRNNRRAIFNQKSKRTLNVRSISGRVDRASAAEAVDTGSIPGQVKPKTIKIGIHSFPA